MQLNSSGKWGAGMANGFSFHALCRASDFVCLLCIFFTINYELGCCSEIKTLFTKEVLDSFDIELYQ